LSIFSIGGLFHSHKGPAENGTFLILDDLGVEKESAWVTEVLYRIINSRYENLLPIVVTATHGLNSLERALGPRIFGRLLETCHPVEIRSPNWRMKVAAKRAKSHAN